ncbi:beta-ketoacyl synthase N-terminal-like domain-containing protein [Streptomyces sp. NPDC007916]|uniref:beta-ketoacyl synthase N-terminal-like domain-containing protein n=1 Tax=Streptomyces sp. NPDC007916 TaxID=3364792 RepID=UPI0036F14A76
MPVARTGTASDNRPAAAHHENGDIEGGPPQFVGISGNEYAHLTAAGPDAWTATGAALGVAAGRLSYTLDLRGPSLAVDTGLDHDAELPLHHALDPRGRQRVEAEGPPPWTPSTACSWRSPGTPSTTPPCPRGNSPAPAPG